MAENFSSIEEEKLTINLAVQTGERQRNTMIWAGYQDEEKNVERGSER